MRPQCDWCANPLCIPSIWTCPLSGLPHRGPLAVSKIKQWWPISACSKRKRANMTVPTMVTMMMVVMLGALNGALGQIPIPEPIVTIVPPAGPVVVGSTIRLSATFSVANILGFGPFLELYVPESCYTLLSATSSYESVQAMPTPINTNFTTASCKPDPILSTILPNTGNCASAQTICGSVSHCNHLETLMLTMFVM